MGAQCPECNTYQPIVGNLTADGKAPLKADQVIIRRLGCGHLIGGEEYAAFDKARRAILAKTSFAIQKVKDDANAQLAQAWKTMKATKEVPS
jgi:hypothetical protein